MKTTFRSICDYESYGIYTSDPHFAVRNVMKCVYYTGSACLFDIPQAYWVIRTIPAPSLFT